MKVRSRVSTYVLFCVVVGGVCVASALVRSFSEMHVYELINARPLRGVW